jgi:hypothetical protein
MLRPWKTTWPSAPDNKRELVRRAKRFTADNEWDGCHSNGILIRIGHISIVKLLGCANVLNLSYNNWIYLAIYCDVASNNLNIGFKMILL